MNRMGLAVALACGVVASGADAKDETYVVVNEATVVPVLAGDLPGRPYTVIGKVTAGVRKATIFSKAASEKKVFERLWERAEKMGADAVINARYGDSHVTAVSWARPTRPGRRSYSRLHPEPDIERP